MLNRSNIEEANKHLQALYSRVSELESVVQEQHEALLAKDSYIQTKIRELSRQDTIIQDLKDKVQAKEKELQEKNQLINELEQELNVRKLEISAMKPKMKALGDMVNVIPQLRHYVSDMESIAVKVSELDNYGYIEVSESPSVSDNGDNTDNVPVKSLVKPSEVKGFDIETKPSDITAEELPTEDVYNHIGGVTVSVREMAQEFVKSGRSKQFSVSEEDDDADEVESRYIVSSRTKGGSKELYF